MQYTLYINNIDKSIHEYNYNAVAISVSFRHRFINIKWITPIIITNNTPHLNEKYNNINKNKTNDELEGYQHINKKKQSSLLNTHTHTNT